MRASGGLYVVQPIISFSPARQCVSISAHRTLGQMLFDFRVPKNVEGWDFKFSGCLDGQPYASARKLSPFHQNKLMPLQIIGPNGIVEELGETSTELKQWLEFGIKGFCMDQTVQRMKAEVPCFLYRQRACDNDVPAAS
ncbi:hypothetical protein MLD38_026822 [Melastoma candidum]|uniref:Uncharacterized protein n=1 Tax=Melastoma candidum TaxID=119954 RepID=A0ACB9P2Z6_9MYRT|nr:hypothetical protein MLD38_026822 [Melastoma candidum]